MENREIQSQELKSKSGYSPEELLDVLVSNPIGLSNNPVNLAKRKARGLAKNVLRVGGGSDEFVSRILPTKQTRMIKEEIGMLPGVEQAEFMRKLCELERERILTAVREVANDLEDDNLIGIQTLGSIDVTDRWSNDFDVILIMEKIDKELARRFKMSVQEKAQKKTDIKDVYLDEDIPKAIEGEIIRF